MVQNMPQAKEYSDKFISDFEATKELISNIRTIRLQKNIPNKEQLSLQIIGSHNGIFDSIISKICNLSNIAVVEEKDPTAASLLVGTTEYAVHLGNITDIEAEIAKLNEELKYQKGFLKSVEAKISNERFVNNAPAAVVETEKKKLNDALSKIKSIEETLESLSK